MSNKNLSLFEDYQRSYWLRPKGGGKKYGAGFSLAIKNEWIKRIEGQGSRVSGQ